MSRKRKDAPPPAPELTIDGLRIDASVFGETRGARCDLSTCKGACCRNGVWVDVGKRDEILASAERIVPHMPPDRWDPSEWFDDETMRHVDFPSGVGVPTAVLPDPVDSTLDTCFFRRLDGLCALQCADPTLKPFDCYTYPLLRSEGEVLLDHFSPGELDGADCQQACTPPGTVLEVFRDELTLMLGEAGYARLVAAAAGT